MSPERCIRNKPQECETGVWEEQNGMVRVQCKEPEESALRSLENLHRKRASEESIKDK